MKLELFAALLAGLLAVTSNVAFAHHGVSGQFDLSHTLTVSGEVARVRFVNPHAYVYFDVTSDAGEVENWRCELSSGSLLKRRGWSTDMFAEGTTIEILGSPDLDDPHTCYSQLITFEDGRVLQRNGSVAEDGSFVNEGENAQPVEKADIVANIAGNWVAPRRQGRPGPFTGPGPRYVLTDAGRKAGAGVTRDDTPRFHCRATNIIHDLTFDQMINEITQLESEVLIRYGFMDVVRTIHLDDDFPDEIEPSVSGYSIGAWNGDRLKVTTRGFAAGVLEPALRPGSTAVMNSEQLVIDETFYVNDDGQLVHEYTIADPINLAQPRSHYDILERTDDEFLPYNCEVLTNE